MKVYVRVELSPQGIVKYVFFRHSCVGVSLEAGVARCPPKQPVKVA